MYAKDVMSRDVVSVKLETTVKEVLELLVATDLHDLPVVNELNQPLGIVSARSILHFSVPSYAGGNLLAVMKGGPDIESVYENLDRINNQGIQDILDKNFEMVEDDTPTSAVAAILSSLRADTNNVLVVSAGVLVGIISARDIICRYITK